MGRALGVGLSVLHGSMVTMSGTDAAQSDEMHSFWEYQAECAGNKISSKLSVQVTKMEMARAESL